ncbi:tryptophan synthase beta subunit-like PLP-dependent enzyme [Amanita rubescens]|nr:tryptophan synthase beta subunit-like PLP-dependent enzyme [Amanita rubescens]
MSPIDLWKETPLIFSDVLSSTLKASVYLKLENLHPSYSFKYRGVSRFVRQAKDEHGISLHAVIASGGNAGLAAACAARALGVKCTVCLPLGAAEQTLKFLRQQNAHVVVAGEIYSDALAVAKQILKQDGHAVMVPAYDDPILWEGHASIVSEISHQLSEKPDAIFCSVGGGGLLGGLIVGCKETGWDDVPLIALETIGSDCFYHSMSLNQQRFNSTSRVLPSSVDLVHDTVHDIYLARFNSFSSRASGSLGASVPSAAVVKMALERTGGTKCVSVADELSMEACLKFADDHKLLVELACSTALVPAYKPCVFNKLVDRSGQDQDRRPVVVFVICGGFKISAAEVNNYKACLEDAGRAKTESSGSVKYDDGDLIVVTG